MQLPKKSSLVNFSLLSELVCPAAFRSFSIKYVCNGIEKYEVNDNTYYIGESQYLIANHFAEGTVEIGKEVKGICIDVAPALLSEVVAGYMGPDTMTLDIRLDKFFTTGDFMDNKYNAADTHLGHFLKAFDKRISREKDAPAMFDNGLYYTVADCIVKDHIPVFRQLQSIKKMKMATRKNLLRRVFAGKEYIDNSFFKPLQIAEVAQQCNISEYHFYRTFKQAFSISPYQYIIMKRIDLAKELIKQGHTQVSDIAMLTGFADVFTFSKSFKRYTGVAPSQYSI